VLTWSDAVLCPSPGMNNGLINSGRDRLTKSEQKLVVDNSRLVIARERASMVESIPRVDLGWPGCRSGAHSHASASSTLAHRPLKVISRKPSPEWYL